MTLDVTLEALRVILEGPGDRELKARRVAEMIRRSADYRWVGIYDVNADRGEVSNIAWSGPVAPAHPVFPITQGLTGEVVAGRKTLNVGDVTQNERYLTTFGTTRSEIIVPVLDAESHEVVGTIDVESEAVNAFDTNTQTFLEQCALVILDLWPV
ncbi:MAG TPA: GAF domain-containing protein [Acidobacteriota bacterium]|jgi:GAF domain-containing protein